MKDQRAERSKYDELLKYVPLELLPGSTGENMEARVITSLIQRGQS